MESVLVLLCSAISPSFSIRKKYVKEKKRKPTFQSML